MRKDTRLVSTPQLNASTKKKIFSRPLNESAFKDKQETQMEDILRTIGTEFDYKGLQA